MLFFNIKKCRYKRLKESIKREEVLVDAVRTVLCATDARHQNVNVIAIPTNNKKYMKINIIRNDIKKLNLLSKFTLILFGIFITSIIFAILIKYLSEFGLWIGLIISLILAFFGFYYIESKTRLRYITWGILGTIVIGATIFFIGLIFITGGIEEIL